MLWQNLPNHFILAGINEGIEIIIFEDGNWEFDEDDEA